MSDDERLALTDSENEEEEENIFAVKPFDEEENSPAAAAASIKPAAAAASIKPALEEEENESGGEEEEEENESGGEEEEEENESGGEEESTPPKKSVAAAAASLLGEVAPNEEEEEGEEEADTGSLVATTIPNNPPAIIAPAAITRAEEEEEEEEEENDNEGNEEEEEEEENDNEGNEEEEEDEEEENNSSLYTELTPTELLNLWDKTTDLNKRDSVLKAMERRNLFPSSFINSWDHDTGAYPDYQDPEFLQKLLAKREFAESLQKTWKPLTNLCSDETRFEVTPVQRFAANLMSPRSPYMSALLYHGVGVGKTCAAVQITEAWLSSFPHDTVILIAPKTIQEGFYKTMFNVDKVDIPEEETQQNTLVGCTGTTYMELTGTLFEKKRERIQLKVMRAIRRRYKVFGYQSFANYVKGLLKAVDEDLEGEEREMAELAILRKQFSGKLMVIDEAHNLNDTSAKLATDEETDETSDEPGGKLQKDDSASGKKLTPLLRKVLDAANGMKLVLMTATPMYNSYREIISILNLLLRNDKKALLTERDVFTVKGEITSQGEELLARVASRYVSFMRGENPSTFPLRLKPRGRMVLSEYPTRNPKGYPVPVEETIFKDKLALVPIVLEGDSLAASEAFTAALPGKDTGISPKDIFKLVQAGNFVAPATPDTAAPTYDNFRSRMDMDGLGKVMVREGAGADLQFRSKTGDAKWLIAENLGTYSPKFVALLEKLKTCEGCAFVYTQFVTAGALPLALVLEANGYTLYGRAGPGLLADGIQDGKRRQCAKCPLRETEHKGAGHSFAPAYYGLLTGNELYSPNNAATIQAQKSSENFEGLRMKVIIGSEVASEGVDLRFVRESHVLDSWYHLNKTEQVIGRAIRYCSHSMLPEAKRNTTIYLYCAIYPDDSPMADRETADLYSYRMAYKKAVQVGRVSRVMKTRAIDCNLNHDAIVIGGELTVQQIDSQGHERTSVSVNDQPFTAICDWIEDCDYKCSPEIKVNIETADDTTYSEFSARWRLSELKERLRRLFALQPYYAYEYLWEEQFADVPAIARTDLFSSIIDNQFFEVEHKGQKGYIKYCNKYYVFQPHVYSDVHIPLAIRAARFPIRRDTFTPGLFTAKEVGIEESGPVDVSTDLYSALETWTSLVEWSGLLVSQKSYPDIPEIVIKRIKSMTKGEKEARDKYAQILDGIQWIHEGFFNSEGTPVAPQFRRILLEYFWDNWFTYQEQIDLVFSNATAAQMIVADMYTKLGATQVRRFFNSQEGSIELLCGKDTPCSKAIVDAVTRDPEEAVKYRITRKNTGELYGFLSTDKTYRIVFKTNKIPKAGESLDRGAICAIGSNMPEKKNFVKKLGEILVASSRPSLDLVDTVFMGSRPIKGATRLCFVTEIALRFLDILQVNGQKWFYRPVAAYLTGHLPGGVTKKAVAAPKVKAAAAPKTTSAAAAAKTTVAAAPKTTSAAAAPKTAVAANKKPSSAVLVRKKKIGAPLAALND